MEGCAPSVLKYMVFSDACSQTLQAYITNDMHKFCHMKMISVDLSCKILPDDYI